MKRNSLYIILAIITAFIIFTTAATCSFCGIEIESEPSDRLRIISEKETNNKTETFSEQTTEQTADTVEQATGQEAETTLEENNDQEIEEAEPEIAVRESTLTVIPEETGSLEIDSDLVYLQGVLIGDLSDNESYLNGYLSFDITGLEGIEIFSANLTMPLEFEDGDRTHLGNLRIGTINYGNGPLSPPAGTIPANMLVKLPNSITDISYSSNELADVLQKKINAGSQRFQLKIYWSTPHNNNDGINDNLVYLKENIHLIIQYAE